jgi:hypothetical protein
MRFRVKRTSVWREDRPCEEAYSREYMFVDERTVDAPEKLKYRNAAEDWISHGENHRVENGHIKRDFRKDGWFIDFDSLPELCAFIDKYGEVIIMRRGNIMAIEIYDDYRE